MDLSVDIRPLVTDELDAAAAILANGMRDNPMHVTVFGPDPELRQRRLLRLLGHLVVYVHSHGAVLGAYVQGELIGVLGVMKPGACRPALMDKLRFAGMIVAGNPPAVVLRISRWLAGWARNHSTDPHWHLGPMAVRPAYRRQGVGRRLMACCCQHLDAAAASAYLETDLDINVAFYETLGFVVIGQEVILGAPNWFMNRPPCTARHWMRLPQGRNPHQGNPTNSTPSPAFAVRSPRYAAFPGEGWIPVPLPPPLFSD